MGELTMKPLMLELRFKLRTLYIMIIKKKLFLVLFIFLGLGISYLLFYSWMKMGYSSQISKIHKTGYPVAPEELEKWYPEPPSGQNAAYFYMKAADNYKRKPDNVDEKLLIIHGGCVEIHSTGIAFSEEMIKNSEAYLEANRKSLDFLHKAAEFKSCRYPVEVDNPDRRLDYLSNLRQGARLLSTEAILAAEKGDSEKTLKSLIAAVALSSSLEKEPTIDSFVAMMGTEHIALENFERILNRCKFNAVQLKQLSAKFAVFDEMKTLERAFAGERTYIFSGHALEEYLEYADYNFPIVRKNKVLKKSFEFMADFLLLWMMNELASADLVSELIELCKGTPESALLKTDAIQERICNLPSRLYATKLYIPRLFPLIDKKAMTIAEARVARVGLALVSFRLKNGRLPETLSELVPTHIESIPADPMDAKPLRYRKTEKEALVYSVGADGIDNGGKSGNNNGIAKGEDFVLRISNP